MFFTQNPIGSSATEDLQDNAISFDYAMNSPAALWQDRFGKQHKTVQQALKDVGFKPAGFDFVSGGTLGISDRDKCVFYPTDGYWYSWNGKLPYVVPVNSSPIPSGERGWKVSEFKHFKHIFSSVKDMIDNGKMLPEGQHVECLGYYSPGDGGRTEGVVCYGHETPDNGSIFYLTENKYVRAFLHNSVMAEKFGVKFDNLQSSADLNTERLQSLLNYTTSNDLEAVLGAGIAWHNGLTITKSSKIKGLITSGPEFGFRVNYVGSTLRNNSKTKSNILVDANQIGQDNVGIHCFWSDFTLYGNRENPESIGGHGIQLLGDINGEKNFIEGSVFSRVQSIYNKELGLAIQGTVFSNDWYNCSFSWNGTHGVSRVLPDNGNPVTNNFHSCKLFENLQWGCFNNGMITTLNICNIAQNGTGGLLCSSGYVESICCDYEQNKGPAIETRDSSGAGIYVLGGKIHKSPGSAPGFIGIKVSGGSSGGIVSDVLFVNFTQTGDKILQPAGGSLYSFSYRLQNVTTGALTAEDTQSVEQIPNLDFPRRGTVVFSGNGPGRRHSTITFVRPFIVGFNISGTLRDTFGVCPTAGYVTTGDSTLASIEVFIDVDKAVGDVYFDWTAIGR